MQFVTDLDCTNFNMASPEWKQNHLAAFVLPNDGRLDVEKAKRIDIDLTADFAEQGTY